MAITGSRGHSMSISPIRAFSATIALILMLTGCAIQRTPPLVRIALLAPFEGADRAIGYEALYAARLALNESADDADLAFWDFGIDVQIWANDTIELLPLDSGDGQAADRARALAGDPLVIAVLLVGVDPDDEVLRAAFGDLPVMYIGDAPSQNSDSFLIFGPLFSAQPGHETFDARYRAQGEFVPVPQKLAFSVYRGTQIIRFTHQRARSRSELVQAMSPCCPE